MMYGYHDGWGTGGWVLMSLLMLAFSALIILAVIALLRSTRANPTPTPAAGPAGSEEPGVSRTGDFGFLRDVVLFEPCQLDFIGSHISQCRVKPDLVIP